MGLECVIESVRSVPLMEGVKPACHALGLSIASMLPQHSHVRPGLSVCKEQVQFLPPGAHYSLIWVCQNCCAGVSRKHTNCSESPDCSLAELL